MKFYLVLALLLSLISTETHAWGSPKPKKEEVKKVEEIMKPEVKPEPSPEPKPEVVEVPKTETPEVVEPVVVPGGTETKVEEIVKTPEETIKVEVVPKQVAKQSDYAVKSTLPYLADVAEVANCVIRNEKFLAEVAEHKQFDYTKDDSKKISKRIAEFTPVILTTYKKTLSKTIAYRNVGSNVVYFNTEKNPRLMKYMVNTAVHERLHVVGYGHGDNSSKGKGNSVPYGIGDLSEKYVKECNKTKTK